MVDPPARQPARMASAASRKRAALGWESASTKKIQSPSARAAPVLRARPIWLTGSNTTSAPPASAICAVRSVELLSHTISSDRQPSRSNPSMPARMLESELGSNRSSLNAGTTTEIFISLATISAYYRFGERELDRGTDAQHNPPAGSIPVRIIRQQRPQQGGEDVYEQIHIGFGIHVVRRRRHGAGTPALRAGNRRGAGQENRGRSGRGVEEERLAHGDRGRRQPRLPRLLRAHGRHADRECADCARQGQD